MIRIGFEVIRGPLDLRSRPSPSDGDCVLLRCKDSYKASSKVKGFIKNSFSLWFRLHLFIEGVISMFSGKLGGICLLRSYQGLQCAPSYQCNFLTIRLVRGAFKINFSKDEFICCKAPTISYLFFSLIHSLFWIIQDILGNLIQHRI